MRFTKAVPLCATTLALTACAATTSSDARAPQVTLAPTERYATCEKLIYRDPAPGKEAVLSCAYMLDLWH